MNDTVVISPETLEKVHASLDARYPTRADFARLVSGQEENLRLITELKAAPAFLPERRKDGKETSLSKIIYCQHYAQKNFGNFPAGREFTREVEWVKRALSMGTTTAGGFLIPEEWSADILQELAARAVVLRALTDAGGSTIPVSGKKLHLGGFGADATFQWLGENVASTESSVTTREVVLSLFTARGYSVGSIEFFRQGSPAADAAVVANMARGLARFIDTAFLQGSGANRPTGMRTVTGIGATGAAGNGANGGALAYDDIAQTIYLPDSKDVPQDSRVWFMHPRTLNAIRKIKDTTNRPIFVDPVNQKDPKLLFGYPVYQSTQVSIAETKGTGTALSFLLLVSIRDIYIAQGAAGGPDDLAVDISDQAEFKAAGIAVRVLAQTDIQPRDPLVITVCDGIQ